MSAAHPLDIATVTIKFPVPSETFVSARLGTIHAMGNRVRVYTMRRPVQGYARLVEERGLGNLELNQNSILTSLRGTVAALARPARLLDTLTWLWHSTRRHPEHLLRALAIVPRSFDLLSRLENDPPDVLHLEWGHFPVVAARLVQQELPDVVVSISLIAYDLTSEFGGTVEVTRAADVVRTQAATNVEQITHFTGIASDRVAVIYDGVDVTQLAHVNGFTEKVKGRVVCAARLVPDKGVDDVIRVFAAALRSAPHATLRILGEGAEHARLQRLVAELGVSGSVDFLGLVSHEQVLRELGQAEVLLHLSRIERLPNVVKEAMACECVPITTRTVGIEELVEHGVTGYVVEHGDLSEATELLSQVLTGEVDSERLTKAGKKFIYKNFDHQGNVEKLVALWREALPSTARDLQIA